MSDTQDGVFDIIEKRWDGASKVERLRKEDDTYKVADEVFDYSTLSAITHLISRDIIHTMNYPISTGKEAKVFRATDSDGKALVVKIHRVSNATVRSYSRYLDGDPRFKRYRRDHRNLVFTWAKKEFKNLQLLADAQITAPAPVWHLKNIVVMDFIGTPQRPAPMLKDAGDADFEALFDQAVAAMTDMALKCELVHGDLSEYNMLLHEGRLHVIDLGQAVMLGHPAAPELLERDVVNVCTFFRKRGVERAVPGPINEELVKAIRGRE